MNMKKSIALLASAVTIASGSASTCIAVDIEKEHAFGEPIAYGNGVIKLCTECGYSLVDR